MPPMTTDTNFEKTFGDLSYTILQDKAPTLLDYLIGFQVLDVNDDQTKAVGIFGCKVGNEVIYIPVFFINGEIKGQELMYLKNQDLFVPLQENWVQYIMNRKPMVMGDTSDLKPKDFAGSNINLQNLTGSFMGKHGSVKSSSTRADFFSNKRGNKLKSLNLSVWKSDNIQPWADKYASCWQNPCTDRYKQAAAKLDLKNFLSELKAAEVASIVGSLVKRSEFGEKVLQFYPVEELCTVSPKFVKRASPEVPQIHLVSYEQRDMANALGLNDEQKKQLMRGEIVIKDNRDNTSKVYRATLPQSFTSPGTTGVYDLLMIDGSICRCLVIVDPITSFGSITCSPYYAGKRKNVYCSIVNLEGEGSISEVRLDDLYGQHVGIGIFSADDVKDRKADIFDMKVGSFYTLVDTKGRGIKPFEVIHKRDNGDESVSYWIETYYPASEYVKKDWQGRTCLTIFKTSSGDGIRLMNRDNMFIPGESTICIEVKDKILTDTDSYDRKERKYRATNGGMIEPGNGKTLEHILWGQASIVPMKVYSTGTEYSITTGKGDISTKSAACMLNRVETLEKLVYEYGINGDTAIGMLKEADANRSSKFLIELANGFPMIKSAYGYSPAMLDNSISYSSEYGVPSSGPNDLYAGIDELDSHGNESLYENFPDENVQQMANSAANTGQKEVFDTAMIGGLLRSSNNTNLVEKYLGDLIIGLDRIGRIYFLYLQHFDQFKERYGENEMSELEDSLKDSFKMLGDLVIFLKQENIDKSVGVDESSDEVNPQKIK